MRLDGAAAPEWPKAGLPGGIVVFLMSDVVGSAPMWDTDHERMDEAVRLLDSLVDDAVDGRGGVVIKPRGEGDSHFSVFRRASDALAAAVDLQRAVAAAAWPRGFALGVRMAVHAAESDSRDGDYYGAGVNRTARLRSAAQAGQILASRQAVDLAAGRLPADVTVRSLGTHRLRDWPGTQEVFQASAPDLASSFAAIDNAADESTMDRTWVRGLLRRRPAPIP